MRELLPGTVKQLPVVQPGEAVQASVPGQQCALVFINLDTVPITTCTSGIVNYFAFNFSQYDVDMMTILCFVGGG